MKPPFYILAALLPLATDLALATPVADPNSDSLEERHRGNNKGYKDHHEYDVHYGYGDENVCEVKYPYPYYKYPCNSSPTNGTSTLGATFTSFCKYQNGDSGIWYSAPKGWVKEGDKPRSGCIKPMPCVSSHLRAPFAKRDIDGISLAMIKKFAATLAIFSLDTSANLHSKFCAAVAPGTGNQIFNVINGDTESFQNLWPRLAARFGCRIPDPMFPNGGTQDTKGFKNYESSTVRFSNKPSLKALASSLGISKDPSAEDSPPLFLQIDPEKWPKREDVNKAWAQLRDKYNLDQDAWDKATWDFLIMAMGRDWSCVGSMSKARKLGSTGYADTWDELEDTFKTLESKGILPPLDQLKRDF
ncbi:hypothetical protein PENFLA_c041G05709 [Penicillium flavigenum]|uniref:Uncharacterized protein n=1 Tax=Penicillium flavigenum TaxID=254877 RepID=A0A1V6SJB5_9EURO|nr:hypothetical protein PENFLA_c041G05709 [Penicillium flavigenum]